MRAGILWNVYNKTNKCNLLDGLYSISLVDQCHAKDCWLYNEGRFGVELLFKGPAETLNIKLVVIQ